MRTEVQGFVLGIIPGLACVEHVRLGVLARNIRRSWVAFHCSLITESGHCGSLIRAQNILNIAEMQSVFYSSALVAADSPLDGMTRIDDGTSPDCFISKSFAASLAAASFLSRSESALSNLHPDSTSQLGSSTHPDRHQW